MIFRFMKMRAFSRLQVDQGLREATIATAAALTFKVGGAFFSFLLGLIIARQFGAQGSGIFALANTVTMMGVTFCLLGFDYSSVQGVAADRATEQWSELRSWVKTAGYLSFFSASVVSVILWFGSEKIAAKLSGGAPLSFSIAVLGLAVIPTTVSKLFSAYLRGMGQSFQANLIDPFLIPAVAVLLFAWPLSSIEEAIVRYLIATFICVFVGMISWFRTLRRIAKARSQFIPWPVLKKSVPTYLTLVGSFATVWITTLVVGAVGSEADAGVYRVAQQFAFILALVPQAVAIGMSPQFAALHATGNLHDIAKISRQMTILVLVVAGIPAILLFFFAEHAMAIFGPEFRTGALTLRILTAGQIIALFFGPIGSVMIMTGLERLSLLNALAGSVLVLAASIVLIPRYGVAGAALAGAVAGTFRLVVATGVVWCYRGLLLPLGLTRSTK
jgi:O-antigen/teichoic acid export membrane protein